jgi:hypothetical protein
MSHTARRARGGVEAGLSATEAEKICGGASLGATLALLTGIEKWPARGALALSEAPPGLQHADVLGAARPPRVVDVRRPGGRGADDLGEEGEEGGGGGRGKRKEKGRRDVRKLNLQYCDFRLSTNAAERSKPNT